ncbi:MAG: hypothetical protein L0Y54_09510 [Sporichthyaceae bacterium]|nr:hypothetical protein [Sporichthyaceae bacterium]
MPLHARRRSGRLRRRAGILLAPVFLLSLGLPQSTNSAVGADECTVSAILVNSCRPWLGVVVDGYPGVGGWRNQVLAHEQRIGRQVDVVHQYHPPGIANQSLTADELFFVNRGTILYINWRPITKWVDAGGGNATINAHIDQMANSIKAVSPHKVIVAMHGEPERFVSPGTSACPFLKGNYGSPAQYRAMWQNVRNRFDALGVNNVVWAMNYLGYYRWDCLFPELWPGNHLVDWVLWDPYIGPNERWDQFVGYFYDALESKSDANHDYNSKPWGIAEFGYWYGTNQNEAYRMYDDIRASLNAGRFPRLKLYEPYDTANEVADTRISYTANGVLDPMEQQRYNLLANDPLLTDDGAPPPPPPPPPPGTDHFAGCDTSVESGLSCFSGTYAGVMPTLQSADGHAGTRSVQVTNSTGSTSTQGLNAKPTPVGSTVVGRTYTGGVWVKASQVGRPLTLLLRERRPANGTAPPNGYTAVTWTATDTQWHFLTGSYVAKEAGNQLTYSVYSSNMPVGSWLRADDFSLTSS